MAKKKLEDILEACLAAMSDGLSFEESLASYPEEASKLRPLLEAALSLGEVGLPAPSDQAKAAARNQFMARGLELRRAKQKPRVFLVRHALGLAVLMVALLTMGGGFTVVAAGRSQPDSFLYPFKLRLEDARLLVTFGDGDRLDFRMDRIERRLSEMRWLIGNDKNVGGELLSSLPHDNRAIEEKLASGDMPRTVEERAQRVLAEQEEILVAAWTQIKPSGREHYTEALVVAHNGLVRAGSMDLRTQARSELLQPDQVAGGVMRLQGPVEQCCQGDTWQIGGVAVSVLASTLVDRERAAVGSYATVTIARGADGRLSALNIRLASSATQPSRFQLRGILEKTDRGQLSVGGQVISPTSRALRFGPLREGAPVQLEGAVVADGSLRIDAIRSLADDGGRSPIVYEGVLDKIVTGQGGEYWLVSGRRFLVSGAIIDSRAGAYAPGAYVRLDAEMRGRGLSATRVLVMAEEADHGHVGIEGRLEVENGATFVSGVPIELPDDVRPARQGSYVRISGQVTNEGKVVAENVTILPRQLVSLEGVVQRVNDRGMEVAGRLIALTATTSVIGQPTEGATVSVWAEKREDGSLVARHVELVGPRSNR